MLLTGGFGIHFLPACTSEPVNKFAEALFSPPNAVPNNNKTFSI